MVGLIGLEMLLLWNWELKRRYHSAENLVDFLFVWSWCGVCFMFHSSVQLIFSWSLDVVDGTFK